ncbi:MAG: NADPH:quinone reductase [Actinomycetota bacterium]|nr:NADPH:quinone reductase [Actinomycetota bacterium]
MRSIVYTETGDASVLQLVEREMPEPGAGEVRVRVVVSGVNPTDWKSRSGSGSAAAAGNEFVPNQDGAGVVDAVGPDVAGLTVGDRVWMSLSAWQRPLSGSAQEFTVLPAERVFHLPASVDFAVGASLGVPAMTAHRALTVSEGGPSRLAPGALLGRIVLVAGGAGAVGHATIQLARWAGATVIATVSTPQKVALATAAGAQHVVLYTDPDPAEQIRAIAPDGVDQIVEVAVAVNQELDAAVAHARTTVSVYANDRGAPFTLDVGRAMRLNLRYQFVLLYTMGAEAFAAAGADIIAALEDGVLPIGEEAGLPLHRFSLEDTAVAHRAVENDTVGKVLIDVAVA